jgi:processive rubber oxygenase RoxA-like protein
MSAGRVRRRRVVAWVAVVLVALFGGVGVAGYIYLTRDEPQTFGDISEHFKYGSIGTEELQGIPYEIWAVIPDVFSDLLPPGSGRGYQRFGFIYEPGRDRAIGMSYREKPIGLVAPNCAMCHTGTYREKAGSPRQVVFGMPANRLRLGDYVKFLQRVGRDERFNADTLLAAIDKRFPDRLNVLERLFYRHAVIPQTKDGLHKVDKDFAWLDRHPSAGPGRVETFTAWKVRLGIDLNADRTIGAVDYPSIWHQRVRRTMHLHWDGNNDSLLERNISASMATGATEDSIDVDAATRASDWFLDRGAPPYPKERIDRRLAHRGEAVYAASCASCHDPGGSRVGRVVPLATIGTDPQRVRSFTPELVRLLGTVGEGKPWHFRHFRKTNGYSSMPLDGIWLRAPYLHNGSVPTLRALLFPAERPKTFYTGYDVYDWRNVGFVASGSAAKREGFRYDTSIPGNANTGHLYGTRLSRAQRDALIEYLKTK